METRTTDVAIIGAGTAGLAARREAHRAGKRALLIERGPHGTTCARVGCMPSKLLLAAADLAHDLAHASTFGIEGSEQLRVDGARVLARVRRERDHFVDSVLDSVASLPDEEKLDGQARFVGPNTLEVDGRIRVEARAVVIATGSRPWIPEALASVEKSLLTSDSLFELRDLPRSVGVLGTGIVGLELGQALARLGVRTVFLSPDDAIGPLTDPEVASVAQATLARELEIHLGVDYRATPAADGLVELSWRTDEGERQACSVERLLVAAGRRPIFDDLELEASGVTLDERGRPRFDPQTMQCGDRPIFVAGDANGDRPFLHEANQEGAIAGRNAAAFPNVTRHHRRAPFSIVFSDPQMAMVGTPFADLDLESVSIGSVSYASQGRARIMDRNEGLVRIYASRQDGRLLGAEMFGPRVEHTSHLLAWAIESGLDVGKAYALPFYHPVIEEGLRTALREICRSLDLVCESHPEDLEHGPCP